MAVTMAVTMAVCGSQDSLDVALKIFELNVIGFVLLVIVAVLLIGLAEGVAGKNKSHA